MGPKIQTQVSLAIRGVCAPDKSKNAKTNLSILGLTKAHLGQKYQLSLIIRGF